MANRWPRLLSLCNNFKCQFLLFADTKWENKNSFCKIFVFYVQQNNVYLSKFQLSTDVIPGPKIRVVIVFYAQNIVNLLGHLFI